MTWLGDVPSKKSTRTNSSSENLVWYTRIVNLTSVGSSIQPICLPPFPHSTISKKHSFFTHSLSLCSCWRALEKGRVKTQTLKPCNKPLTCPGTEPKSSVWHQILTSTLHVHHSYILLGVKTLESSSSKRSKPNPNTSKPYRIPFRHQSKAKRFLLFVIWHSPPEPLFSINRNIFSPWKGKLCYTPFHRIYFDFHPVILFF